MLSKNDLKDILYDWNLWGGFDIKHKPRSKFIKKIWPSIKQQAFVTVLTGVRRSGKSSLGIMLLKKFAQKTSPQNTLNLMLEDPRFVESLNLDLLEKTLDTFLEEISINEKQLKLIFIDEIQLIPQWERFIRSILDRKLNIKLIISGSSAHLLSRELSTSLTGRNISYEVFPLSFLEFLEFKDIDQPTKLMLSKSNKNIKRHFNSYLKTGGFPEVVLTKNKSLQGQILRGLFGDVINKDIVNRYKIKNRESLLKFAHRMINQNTSYISAYEEEKSLDISFPTALDYLSYLEESYLIVLLSKFSFSLKKQTRYPRKVFAIDHGFYNQLAFISSHRDAVSLENAIFIHFRRQTKDIWYWSNKKHEVDLVVKEKKQIVPVNITYSIEDPVVRQREEAGLFAMMDEFNLPKAKLIIQDGAIPDKQKIGDHIIEYISALEFVSSPTPCYN